MTAQIEEAVLHTEIGPLRTAEKTAITVCSVGVRGATRCARGPVAPRSGAGSALRSSLPFAVSGRRSSTTSADGTM